MDTCSAGYSSGVFLVIQVVLSLDEGRKCYWIGDRNKFKKKHYSLIRKKITSFLLERYIVKIKNISS